MPDLRRRLATLLEQAVHEGLAARREHWMGLSSEVSTAEQQLAALATRTQALARSWEGLVDELSERRLPVRAEMTVDQAWRRHPGARDVFTGHGLPACDGCAVRFDETLEEAAEAYGLDLQTLLAELRALQAW